MNYFLYARKSTDVEDKQVRSIEDQLAVLRASAKEQGLHVVAEFVEKQSAKVPGRPIFNDMMKCIESGEASGIVCWKLDRLARNPVDGGQVSWFLQRGVIAHIHTNDRSYYPTDNVLMMSVEFGVANQYIIDLAANTKRGLYEKVKRGEYPSLAPVGYINDPRTKTIAVDRKKARTIKAGFELYAEGNSRLQDISMFFAEHSFFSKVGNAYHRDRITRILTNPFYCGFFRYAGELYEGKHEPIVSKRLFDKVQGILKENGRPHHKPKNDPRSLCGLFRCGECGMMITAEVQRGHVYYRCTKKSAVRCSQPYVREEELTRQLSGILASFAMPEAWAAELSKMADKDEQESLQASATVTQAMRSEIEAISQKLQRLLTTYLDQDIEREAYRSEKADLLSRKKSLEEKIGEMRRGTIAWLEQYRNWLKDAQMLGETIVSPSLSLQKSSLQKISGSNVSLKNRVIEFNPLPHYDALRASSQNFSENNLCNVLVPRPGIEPRTRRPKRRVISVSPSGRAFIVRHYVTIWK